MSPTVQGRGAMTPYHRGYYVQAKLSRTLQSIPHQNSLSPCL